MPSVVAMSGGVDSSVAAALTAERAGREHTVGISLRLYSTDEHTVRLTDGTTITATDTYLVRVIQDPTTLKVVGYDPSLMASYIPPGSISRSQAIALTAYIKTLK